MQTVFEAWKISEYRFLRADSGASLTMIYVEQTLYRLIASEKASEEIIILLNAVNQLDSDSVKSNNAA